MESVFVLYVYQVCISSCSSMCQSSAVIYRELIINLVILSHKKRRTAWLRYIYFAGKYHTHYNKKKQDKRKYTQANLSSFWRGWQFTCTHIHWHINTHIHTCQACSINTPRHNRNTCRASLNTRNDRILRVTILKSGCVVLHSHITWCGGLTY